MTGARDADCLRATFKVALLVLAVLSCIAQIVSLSSKDWVHANPVVNEASGMDPESANRSEVDSEWVVTTKASLVSFHCGIWVICEHDDWRRKTEAHKRANGKPEETLINQGAGDVSKCSSFSDGSLTFKLQAISRVLLARHFGIASVAVGSASTILLGFLQSPQASVDGRKCLLSCAASLFVLHAALQMGSACAANLWIREMKHRLPDEMLIKYGWGIKMAFTLPVGFALLAALAFFARRHQTQKFSGQISTDIELLAVPLIKPGCYEGDVMLEPWHGEEKP